MKILYLSSHDCLEAADIQIFNSLGHDIFPVGHYSHPETPIKSGRDKFKGKVWQEGRIRFDRLYDYQEWASKLAGIKCWAGNPYLFKVNPDLVNPFDVVIVNCYEENLTLNWNAIKDKPIIFRTISQGVSHISPYRNNVKVVAMSENEESFRNLKHHAIIRQCIDTNYYNGWDRKNDCVLTVNKWLKKRGIISAWEVYSYVSKNFKRIAIGSGNEDVPGAMSDLSEEETQRYRRACGAYFSLCSKPGCVTYSFMEALSTGIPVVSVGPLLGSVSHQQMTFNVDKFIKNGVNGFYSDNASELIHYIEILLEDEKLGKKIGEAGRKTAIEHFSFEKAASDWKNFLKEHIS